MNEPVDGWMNESRAIERRVSSSSSNLLLSSALDVLVSESNFHLFLVALAFTSPDTHTHSFTAAPPPKSGASQSSSQQSCSASPESESGLELLEMGEEPRERNGESGDGCREKGAEEGAEGAPEKWVWVSLSQAFSGLLRYGVGICSQVSIVVPCYYPSPRLALSALFFLSLSAGGFFMKDPCLLPGWPFTPRTARKIRCLCLLHLLLRAAAFPPSRGFLSQSFSSWRRIAPHKAVQEDVQRTSFYKLCSNFRADNSCDKMKAEWPFTRTNFCCIHATKYSMLLYEWFVSICTYLVSMMSNCTCKVHTNHSVLSQALHKVNILHSAAGVGSVFGDDDELCVLPAFSFQDFVAKRNLVGLLHLSWGCLLTIFSTI